MKQQAEELGQKETGVVTYPNPDLRKNTTNIDNITDEVQELANLLVQTMIQEEGIGLAGPQVGVLKKIITVDVEDDFHILINPVVISTSSEEESMEEGCLSIPGVQAEVQRPLAAKIKGVTLEGKEIQLEREGLPARVLLHEIDHLSGTLFIDHLSEASRSITLKEYRQHVSG